MNAAIRRVVSLFESHFAGRVRGYYLTGSYTDGSAVPASDVDVGVLFKEGWLNPDEQDAANSWSSQLNDESLRGDQGHEIALDVHTDAEATINPVFVVSITSNTWTAFGDEPRVEEPDFEEYVRCLITGACRYVAKLRRQESSTRVVEFPVGWPIPGQDFFGYETGELKAIDGIAMKNTKSLVQTTLRCASAVIAIELGVCVPSASVCTQHLPNCGVPDAALLDDLYERCRDDWHYLLPPDGEREDLRRLCDRVLAFENHVLNTFRDRLSDALLSGDPRTQIWAANALAEVVHTDNRTLHLLRGVVSGSDERLAAAVRHALVLTGPNRRI